MTDQRTNSLIVAASEEAFEDIFEVIEQLDVPAKEEAPPEPEYLLVYNLRHAPIDLVAAALQSLVMDGKMRFATDPRDTRIIIRGTAKMHKEVQELIQKLDTPPPIQSDDETPDEMRAVRVRAIWLVAGGRFNKDLPQPADDLDEVVAELSKIGLERLRQVAQTVVSTMPQGRFMVNGAPVIRQGDGEQATEWGMQWQVGGSLTSSKDKPDWQLLEIQLKATTDDNSLRGRREGPLQVNMADLKTQLMVPFGHFVVLGSVPYEDNTFVFVVQVTRVDPIPGAAPQATVE